MAPFEREAERKWVGEDDWKRKKEAQPWLEVALHVLRRKSVASGPRSLNLRRI
jgi:hypothetical protein